MDLDTILSHYVAGYFPLYDASGRFYWERLWVRAVLPVNAETARRARRMARRPLSRPEFSGVEFRYATAVEEIIGLLQQEDIKPDTWVRKEVIEIYRLLHEAGALQTVEAWRGGKLIGALVGIRFPGTFIAETMVGLVPEASKLCLCRLVEDCFAQGCEWIDVQTPHHLDHEGRVRDGSDGMTPHPCMRLGEMHLPIATFLLAFRGAWGRAFAGDARAWVEQLRLNRERTKNEVGERGGRGEGETRRPGDNEKG